MIDCGSTFYPSNRSNSCDRKIKTSWNQCTVCSSVMKLVVKVDDSNLLHLYGSKECQTVNSETSHWAQPTSAHIQHHCLCRKKINIYCQISAVIVVGSVIWLTDYKSVWFLSEIRGAMMYFTASCVADFTTQRCMYDHSKSQTSNRRKLTVFVLHLTQEQRVGSGLQLTHFVSRLTNAKEHRPKMETCSWMHHTSLQLQRQRFAAASSSSDM